MVFPIKASLLMLHYEKFIATCYTKTNIIILIGFNIVYMFLNLLLVFHSNLSLSHTQYTGKATSHSLANQICSSFAC